LGQKIVSALDCLLAFMEPLEIYVVLMTNWQIMRLLAMLAGRRDESLLAQEN